MKRHIAALVAVFILFAPGLAQAAPPPGTSKVKAATVTPTLSGIKYQLKQFSRWRTEHVGDIAAETEDGISGDLMLAMASRETGLRNIVGGGVFDSLGQFIVLGTDRGLWQINETFHRLFLWTIPGCDSGTYKEVYPPFNLQGGEGALRRGRVPGLSRGLQYAIKLLQQGVVYATQQGVPAEDAVQVAVAGYNAGAFNAVRAYREGDPDRFTTGGDYSSDTFKRRTLVRRARKSLGFR